MMGFGFGIVIYLIVFVILLLLLHYIIRTAINNSEMSETLKEIRDLLKSQNKDDG